MLPDAPEALFERRIFSRAPRGHSGWNDDKKSEREIILCRVNSHVRFSFHVDRDAADYSTRRGSASMPAESRLCLMSDMDIGERVDQAEDLQQPENDCDHD